MLHSNIRCTYTAWYMHTTQKFEEMQEENFTHSLKQPLAMLRY